MGEWSELSSVKEQNERLRVALLWLLGEERDNALLGLHNARFRDESKCIGLISAILCVMLVAQYNNTYVRTIDTIPINTKPIPA
jgi:hypothetical protein